jgi:hypothetical protein
MIKSKLMILGVILALSLLSAGSYYFYTKGSQAKEQEIIIQKQETYINTRRRIDEATRNDQSLDSAIDRLRTRQQNRSK